MAFDPDQVCQTYSAAAATSLLAPRRLHARAASAAATSELVGILTWINSETVRGRLQAGGQSGFTWGIPNARTPVEHPDEIVYQSLQHAKPRTGLPGVRFRPWLQNFTDYAFDHRAFGAARSRGRSIFSFSFSFKISLI